MNIKKLTMLGVLGLSPLFAVAEEKLPLSLDTRIPAWSGDLDGMIERRIIRVLVPYSKTLYFVDIGGQQRGMSYDFMQAFEDQLNQERKSGALPVHVVMIPVTRDQLLPSLKAGYGDIAAANITITEERQKQVDFTIPLMHSVRELIVTGPGAPLLKTLDDLAGREIFVRRESSYYESLVVLNKQFKKRKLLPMKLHEAPGHFETEDILEMANAGLVKIVVADAYLAYLWKQVYPDIRVHDELILRDGGHIAFAIRKNSPRLLKELDIFVTKHRQGTTFGNLTLQEYFQKSRWVRSATTPSELKKFNTLRNLFQKYGEKYHIDPLLIAAQAYQESQLDQERHSSAGAIGIMQIMPATGKQMQVGDITKLEPNIHAGAKYIRHLMDEYFNDQSMDDLNKALFAFAAYNAGPSRIRTLRNEAKERGLAPNLWFNNVERMAALRIGNETVQYVSNIYKYYYVYSLVQEDFQQDLTSNSMLLKLNHVH